MPRSTDLSVKDYVARAIVAAVVILVHWVVLHGLRPTMRAQSTAQDRAMIVTFIASLPQSAELPAAAAPNLPAPAPRMQDRHAQPDEHAITPPPPLLVAPTGKEIDWSAEARRAAEAHATEDEPHHPFGSPSGPPNEKPKQFHWAAKTRGVEELPEGGLAIWLSNDCMLVVAPVPLVGCRVGTLPPRGDLFDDMSRPRRPGDWKDDSRNER